MSCHSTHRHPAKRKKHTHTHTTIIHIAKVVIYYLKKKIKEREKNYSEHRQVHE